MRLQLRYFAVADTVVSTASTFWPSRLQSWPCTITRAPSRSSLTHMEVLCSPSMTPTGVLHGTAMEARARKAGLGGGQDFGAAVGLELDVGAAHRGPGYCSAINEN